MLFLKYRLCFTEKAVMSGMQPFRGKERKQPVDDFLVYVRKIRRECFTKARGKHPFWELKVIRAMGRKIRRGKDQLALPVSGSLETLKEPSPRNDEARSQIAVGWRVKES